MGIVVGRIERHGLLKVLDGLFRVAPFSVHPADVVVILSDPTTLFFGFDGGFIDAS